GAHRAVVHRIVAGALEARLCVLVAAAALGRGRDMWRRGLAGRGGAVVAGRAIGGGGGGAHLGAPPAHQTRPPPAIGKKDSPAAGRHVSGLSAVRTFCSSVVVRDVVPVFAAARAVVGRVVAGGAEAWRCVLVAVAALERPGRNMRRRLHAGGGRVVVAARAIG